MAFSPGSFKSAIGKPMGGSKPPMGTPDDGMDIGALMAPPKGIEDTGLDVEGPGGEAGEQPLEQLLEQGGYSASPDQISQIKQILGLAGGNTPDMGSEDMGGDLTPPTPEAPAAKPSSKISKMFGR